MSGIRAPWPLRLALRLYPAGYRDERGAEIAAVFADNTTGAGRLATVREVLGVAGYGLRVRTGLTAGGGMGQLLATTAPLAAAAAVGDGLRVWLGLPQEWRTLPDEVMGGRVEAHGFVIAQAVVGALWLLVMVAALYGRWTVARVSAALAGVGVIVQAGVWNDLVFGQPGVPLLIDPVTVLVTVGAPLTWALLLFAAPPELLRAASWRTPRTFALPLVVLTASALVAELINGEAGPDRVLRYLGWGVVGPVLVLLSLLGLRRSRLLPTATVLALLPSAVVVDVTFVLGRYGSYSEGWVSFLLLFGWLVLWVAELAVVGLLVSLAARRGAQERMPGR